MIKFAFFPKKRKIHYSIHPQHLAPAAGHPAPASPGAARELAGRHGRTAARIAPLAFAG